MALSAADSGATLPRVLTPLDRAASTTLLPPGLLSPKVARVFTRASLSEWHRSSSLDNVEVVVNELVSRAVLHAGGPITLSLQLQGDVVHIEVLDDSVGVPTQQRCGEPNLDGLHTVAALSQDWGTRPHPTGGKAMWADVIVDPVVHPGRSTPESPDNGTDSLEASK